MVKNPNWRSRGVELWATEKHLLLAVRVGPEPEASGVKSDALTHSTTLPPSNVTTVTVVMNDSKKYL